MKLGFVSAILDGWNFEEMIDTASEMGFSCVEVACWPCGKAERRYAGVSHINVDELTDERPLKFWLTAPRRAWRFPLWLSTPTPWTLIWKSAPPTWNT